MNIPSETTTSPTDWPELHRQRRAIVVVDVVESVRLMQANEADVIDRWRRFVNEVRTKVLPAHGGRLVKSLGDGLLLEFESVQSAVTVSTELLRCMRTLNAGRASFDALMLRVGVHLAEVVVDELDIYGSGVNLAARIASLAAPGEMAVSAAVRDEIVDGVDGVVHDLGPCFIKHLTEPVHVYRLVVDPDPSRTPWEGDASPSPVIAVLPFKPRLASSDELAIGSVISADVIGALSRVASWRVVSQLSTDLFRTRELPVSAVAGHLNANYVVTGRFACVAGRVTVDVEMTEAVSGQIAWSRRCAGSAAAMISGDGVMIDEIVNGIGKAILDHELNRARALPMRNLESYTLLLSAINFMHRASTHDFDRARQMLEFLVERHPRLPAAHSWLGKWYALKAAQGWSRDQVHDASLATAHVNRALAIDDTDALAWTIDGLIRGYIRKDLDGAASAYRKALEANPNESLAWLYTSTLHAWRDKGEEAGLAADRAVSLSPLDPLRYYFDSLSATAYAVAGDHARAIESANRSLRANLAHASTYRILAIAQALSGDLDQARNTAARLAVVQPGLTVAKFRDNYPGRESTHVEAFCDALAQAGVPR